ncbi:MAG: thioredoxin-dependent thiol peroxidase [Gemmatimonas sp.]
MTGSRESAVPAPGSAAPDFTLPTDEGHSLTLSSLRGQTVVLFFYPKDNTPGCTIEACSMRDAFPQFEGANAVILGISPDSIESHKGFRARFRLPYNLLSDADHVVAAQYGVWGKRSIFGLLNFDGILRTTFVIDKHGNIAHVFEDVHSLGHGREVVRAVTELDRRG